MPLIIGDSILSVNTILENKTRVMDDLVVAAGTFEVSDRKRGVILKSLDTVTTAGAGGDIYGALPEVKTLGQKNNYKRLSSFIRVSWCRFASERT